MIRVAALLFDLGDTLWHFPDMPSMERVEKELVDRLDGLLASWRLDGVADVRSLAIDIRSAVQEETRQSSLGNCISPDYPEICRRAALASELSISASQAAELWEAWSLGGVFLGRRLFPDAMDTLHWLRDRGYRLGCVTNRGYGGPRFQEELRESGLAELFEAVSVSADIGYLKPHPRIFLHALESMDLVPHRTAMVGDSLRADVGGAKALGMVAVWRHFPAAERGLGPSQYPDVLPEEAEVKPDFVIDCMADIKRLPIVPVGNS